MGNQGYCHCYRNQYINEKTNIKVPQNNLKYHLKNNYQQHQKKKILKKRKKENDNTRIPSPKLSSKNSDKISLIDINKNNLPRRSLTHVPFYTKKIEYVIYNDPELNFVKIHKKIVNLNKTINPNEQVHISSLNKNIQRTMIYIGIFGSRNSGKKMLYYKIFNSDLKTMENYEEGNEILMNKRKYYYNSIPYDLNITLYSYKDDNIYNYGKQLDYFIIIYDIGNYNSFEKGKNFIEFIKNKGYGNGKKIIFLANKIDLYDNVKFNTGRKYCDENNFFYYQISLKNDYELISEIIDNMISDFEEQFN